MGDANADPMLTAKPNADQERFRQAHRQLGAIITASPLAIVGVNSDMTVFLWNAAAERIFGWTEAEVLGRPVPIIPDNLKMDAGALLQRVLADEMINGAIVRRQRRDGTLIDMRLHTAALRDAEGHITGAVGMFEDISEQQRVERQKNAIADLASALRSAFSRAEIMHTVLRVVMELLPAEGAAISVPMSDGLLLCEFTAGLWSPWNGRIVPAAGSTGSQVLATGTPFISNDIAHDERLIYRHLMQTFNSAACVPLMAQHGPVGVLWVNRKRAPFTPDDTYLLTAVADIAATAIHRAELLEQTELRLRRLDGLRQVDNAITGRSQLGDVMRLLLDHVVRLLPVDAADVFVLSPASQRLLCVASQGFAPGEAEGLSFRIHEGCVGRIAAESGLLSIPDLSVCAEECELRTVCRRFKTYHGLPLLFEGRVEGVLEVFHRQAFQSDPEWLDFLESLGNQAAIAMHNVSLLQRLESSNTELQQAYDSTLEGWARAMDLRDRETQGHVTRVADWTCRLGYIVGMTTEQLVYARRGALLHDIGKLGIPDTVLQKPGPLTTAEWDIMHRHPEYAYDMLSPIAYLEPALDIPYCHHERWDGTGYPRQLQGEQIPLAARVFAIIDVWDALTSNRVYRLAWPPERVYDYLHSESGHHFDPRVVTAFFEMLEQP